MAGDGLHKESRSDVQQTGKHIHAGASVLGMLQPHYTYSAALSMTASLTSMC
jgi:hypothetical protein